jgi:hypothetical protein
VRLLCNTGDDVRKVWLKSCRQSFANMLAEKQFRENEEMKAKAQISHSQPDDLIDFYHLKSRRVSVNYFPSSVFHFVFALWELRISLCLMFVSYTSI